MKRVWVKNSLIQIGKLSKQKVKKMLNSIEYNMNIVHVKL